MKLYTFTILVTIMLTTVLLLPAASADKINAADVSEYQVLNRGDAEIQIDAAFDDWASAQNILVMGEDTWEPLGGNWDGPDDLTAELRVLYDADNLYFAFVVTDDEYIAEAENPWENDGAQMAIDTSAGTIPAGWPNDTTHLYNFSIKDGWQQETGPFLGDAEIEMKRDEDAKQTLFEWRMPVEIIAAADTQLEAGMEIAFAIIVNDSDQDAKGQTGWVGWGCHCIVFGKNPEEMKTLVLDPGSITAVDVLGKLTTTWGALKR
jgi:hypothetical protein